jgi:ferredoxin
MKAWRIDPVCTSCEACVAICPTGSIFFGGHHFVIDTDTCEGSGICARICYVNAVRAPQGQGEEGQAEGASQGSAKGGGSAARGAPGGSGGARPSGSGARGAAAPTGPARRRP